MPDRWQRELIDAVPRLLSLQDRDPTSVSFGCFDRRWWGWKFSDFPAPRAQEGLASLAALWALQDPRNPCYQKPSVLAWIAAGLRFAARIQHADGSFDEAYPNERSWGATAFIAAACADVLERVGAALEPSDRGVAVDIIRNAARFLVAHDETHGFLSNHRAAAAAALAAACDTCGDPTFGVAADRLVDGVRARGSNEGWLLEYAGADPGYQSHALGYLAAVQRRRGGLGELLGNCCTFLGWFVAPDGSLGGEYGSRNTSFWFPGGAESLAATLPQAARLARRLRDGRATGLAAMDAQNFLPLLGSIATAALCKAPAGEAMLPTDAPARRWFPEAGLLVHATSRYVAVASAHKGVVIANGRDGSTFSSAGWVAGDATSQGYVKVPPVDLQEDSLVTERAFFARKSDRFEPGRFVAFRLATLGPARFAPVGARLKAALVKRLVSGVAERPLTLRRCLHFAENELTIQDRVSWRGAAEPVHVERFTAIHMGSSGYFQAAELAPRACVVVEERRTPGCVERTQRVRF